MHVPAVGLRVTASPVECFDLLAVADCEFSPKVRRNFPQSKM